VRISLADPVSYTIPYDRSLAEALARRGHDVDLLLASFLLGELPPPDGYRTHEIFFTRSARFLRDRPRSRLRFLLKGAEYLPSARRLLARLGELEPDVVHVQWLPRPELDRRWVRRLRAPSVLTAHDVVPRRERARAVWPGLLNWFGRVIVHSQDAVRRLAELGVGAVWIPHPVFELERLPSPSGKTLLFFGLIRDYKGVDVLVRALADMPEATLVVAGDPVDSVGPAQALAGELGVAERIDWRLGYLPDADVRELMERSAAVVLPYRRLDSSGVLATAIGYGRPVVVTDVGSLGEQVREFGAGRVVPPEDAAALAEACNSLLQPEELEQAAAGARNAAQALTWDASAEAHERLYEELRAS
jgi:glycosyltransferase involved in cell wall biosynthesis